MKRIFTIIILLMSIHYCFSQTGTIKGNIQDNRENEGLAFANIYLLDTNIVTHTDLKGDFLIEKIPIGMYDIKISYVGYADSIITSINVTTDTVIKLNIDYPGPCKYDNSKRKRTCPKCKKRDEVIPIVYGYPSDGLLQDANKGKVKLGGCMISDCDPNRYCKRCKKEF